MYNHRSMPRPPILAAACAAALAVAAGGGAAPRAEPPGDVLHEYVPLGPLRCEGGKCRRAGAGQGDEGAGALPEAIEAGGDVVDAPAGGAFPQEGEQVYAPQPLEPVVAGGTPPF